jgi:arsenate reductase-like glutaredoxin family protein
MALTIYGIRNCNTVKSAVDWLTKNKVAFEFHDFKSKGIPAVKLKAWCS